MPKILLYITAKIIWQFLFWNTDFNENRAHVHVGKRSTEHLCKIWLEPVVELDKQGDLTDAQAREVLDIAIKYREKLLQQWKLLMPVSAFPSLKKVPVKERNNWYLMGGGVTWDSCPEVIHIEQILGNYQNYAHELA